MPMRMAGEPVTGVQGLDRQGWVREARASEASPVLRLVQSGAGGLLEGQGGSGQVYINGDGTLAVAGGTPGAPGVAFVGVQDRGLFNTGSQTGLSAGGLARLYLEGSLPQWTLVVVAPLRFDPDASYDIGEQGGYRPRDLYVAGEGNFGGMVSLRHDAGDFGGNFANYTPPPGREGALLVAQDTNATAPGHRLYVFSGGAWRYVSLT